MLKILITTLMLLTPLALAAQDNARTCGWEFGKWVCRDKNENPLEKLDSPNNGGDAFQEAFNKAKKGKKNRTRDKEIASTGDDTRGGSLRSPDHYKVTLGNDFMETCVKTNVLKDYCNAYVRGVVNGLQFSSYRNEQILAGIIPPMFCLQGGITVGQTYDVFVKYLIDNPSIRHINTTQLIAQSLTLAFPCQP